MPSIQKFCDAMRWAADSDQVGYSQSDRDSLGPADFYGDGLYNTDCSKLVIAALQHAGFETGWATYTGNMSDALCANGWERLSPWADLQPGDILLNDSDHVAVWLGDCLAQASIDENGNIAGGARGDQTGNEVNARDFYSYPWDCVLRHAGGSDYSGQPSGGSGESTTGREWQGDMVGYEDTTGSGDDYAGVFGKPIRYIAIEGVGEYQVHDKNGSWWPCVSKYDLNDEDNGMAGAGNPIDALRIKDPTVCYQTHNMGGDWNAVMKGTHDTGGSSDDFAGDCGVAQDAVLLPQNLYRWWHGNHNHKGVREGLGCAGMVLHELRHSNLTMMARHLSPFDLQRYAGWSSLEPARVYIHEDMESVVKGVSEAWEVMA